MENDEERNLRRSRRVRRQTSQFNSFAVASQEQHRPRLVARHIVGFQASRDARSWSRIARLHDGQYEVLMNDGSVRSVNLLRLLRYRDGERLFLLFIDQRRRTIHQRGLIHAYVQHACETGLTMQPNFCWIRHLRSCSCQYQPGHLRLNPFSEVTSTDSGCETSDTDDGDYEPDIETDSEDSH